MEGCEGCVVLQVFVDSSAAKSFASKRGSGKMRHMEVRWLWLQGEVRKGRVRVEKVWGKWTPAELMTKYLTASEVEERSGRMGLEIVRIERTEEEAKERMERTEEKVKEGQEKKA